MYEKHLIKSVAQVLVLTTIIKFFAFVKQVVIARYFGSSVNVDLYLLSVDTLGDFSIALFSAASVSTLTLYTRYLAQDEHALADCAIYTSLRYFVPLSLVFSVVFYLLSDEIACLVASRYSVEEQNLVGQYIRIVCPTVFFVSIAYIYIAVLDANKVFLPGKLINLFLSLSIILCTINLGREHGVLSLVIAYTSAYFMNMTMTVLIGRRFFKISFVKKRKDSTVTYSIFKMLLPMVLGNAAIEINALVDKLLAAELGDGYVSSLIYGGTLNNFVTSILVAAATTLVPYFTEFLEKGESKKLCVVLENGSLAAIAVLLPVTAITLLSSTDIVWAVYNRGEFNTDAVFRTSQALRGYAVGFTFVILREMFLKVYIADRDSKTISLNSIITIAVNTVLSIVLSKPLGMAGISLGTSLAAIVGLLLSLACLKKLRLHFSWGSMFREGCKILLSCSIAYGVSVSALEKVQIGIHIARFAFLCLVFAIVYLGVLLLVKSKIFSIVKKTILALR